MQQAGLGRIVLFIALAACSAPQPPAKAPGGEVHLSSPSSAHRAAAFPIGECARLLAALPPLQRLAASGIDRTTPDPTLQELLRQSEAAADVLERERDALTSPVLAAELNQSMLATLYVSHGIAELLGLRHLGRSDLDAQEHTLYVARQQLQVTSRAARARCEEEPSREQSAAWKAAAFQTLTGLAPILGSCADAESARAPVTHSTSVTVAIHVAADGRVSLAGPAQFNMLSGLSGDFVYCALRCIEAAQFAPPRDAAILHVPLALAPGRPSPSQ